MPVKAWPRKLRFLLPPQNHFPSFSGVIEILNQSHGMVQVTRTLNHPSVVTNGLQAFRNPFARFALLGPFLPPSLWFDRAT